MNTIKFFLLMLLSFVEANAQVSTISFGMLPDPGEVYSYLDDTISAHLKQFTAGSAGAGVTWDFSDTLTAAGIQVNTRYLGPDLLPLSDSVFIFSSIGTTSDYHNYNYFKKNAEGFFFYGGRHTPLNGTPYVFYYGNPLKLLQVPFTYGDSFTDKFTAGYPSSPGFSATRRGTIEATADGYGTLIMPNGQVFTDVIRVKNQIMLTDTNYNLGKDSLMDIFYDYYQGSSAFPLIELGERKTYTWSSQAYSSQRYLHLRDEGSFLAQTKALIPFASAYPNPVNDLLQVNISEEAPIGTCIELYSTGGSLICRHQNIVRGSTQTLDMKNLPSGIYFLNIIGGKYTGKHKIVKP
jgi:hypothetical protein